MLDHPDKTTKLLAALKAAVPFEVELTEWLVKQLRAQHHAGADQKHHTVSDLSYAGDQGGIVCHIVPPEKQEVLVVSLTQVHVPRAMPLAAAIADYQKHRVKKLKKQDGTKSSAVPPSQSPCGPVSHIWRLLSWQRTCRLSSTSAKRANAVKPVDK
jgi:hypothetical protein